VSEPVLAEAAVIAALSAEDGPDWHLIAGKLVKTVACADFVAALTYVGEVGRLAEAANHHPDIDIRYNRVTLALMTHDSDGITRLDLELARAVDRIGP
jgi:4a-hydroxytetrahydrobiopterin dehydratase